MGRTASTEPQYPYKGALYLFFTVVTIKDHDYGVCWLEQRDAIHIESVFTKEHLTCVYALRYCES